MLRRTEDICRRARTASTAQSNDDEKNAEQLNNVRLSHNHTHAGCVDFTLSPETASLTSA